MTARRTAPPERLAFTFGTVAVQGGEAADRTSQGEIVSFPPPVAKRRAEKEKRDWGYLGLLTFTVVLLVRPQDQIPGLDALRLAELSAVAAVLATLTHRVSRRLPIMRMTPELAGLLVFGAAILISVPFSIWPTGALTVFFDAYLKVLVVFLLMMNTLTTPKRLQEITWVMVICCTYVAARSLFDYARGLNLVEGDRLSGAVGGIFGNPNDLAMNMVAFLPAAAVVALGRGHTVPRRLVAAGAVAFMLGAVIATKSRGGVLGLLAVLLTLMVLGRKVRPGFAVGIVLIVLATIPFMPASFSSRMASMLSDEQDREEFTGSREARTTVMREGLQAFITHPLAGVGAGQFPNYDPPQRKERWRETHNALIQVAAETGVLGLLAFSFLIIRAGLAAAATRRMLAPPRRSRTPDVAAAALTLADGGMQTLAVALTAGLAGWFVCSLFASVAYNWTFYYLLALIVAARELTRARLDAARLRAEARTDTGGFTVASVDPIGRAWAPERYSAPLPGGSA